MQRWPSLWNLGETNTSPCQEKAKEHAKKSEILLGFLEGFCGKNVTSHRLWNSFLIEIVSGVRLKWVFQLVFGNWFLLAWLKTGIEHASSNIAPVHSWCKNSWLFFHRWLDITPDSNFQPKSITTSELNQQEWFVILNQFGLRAIYNIALDFGMYVNKWRWWKHSVL